MALLSVDSSPAHPFLPTGQPALLRWRAQDLPQDSKLLADWVSLWPLCTVGALPSFISWDTISTPAWAWFSALFDPSSRTDSGLWPPCSSALPPAEPATGTFTLWPNWNLCSASHLLFDRMPLSVLLCSGVILPFTWGGCYIGYPFVIAMACNIFLSECLDLLPLKCYTHTK